MYFALYILFITKVNNTKCKKSRNKQLFPADYINLASTEPSSDYMALKISFQPSSGYELSLGLSLAKIGQLEVENNCIIKTHTYKFIYI